MKLEHMVYLNNLMHFGEFLKATKHLEISIFVITLTYYCKCFVKLKA